jgi:hypothetical protein
MSRRGFVQAGALGAMGLTLPRFLQAQRKPSQKSVVLVWLWGGPPHLDTFDMKPNAPLEYRGPYRPVSTPADGIQVCEYLPKIGALAREWSLVRSLHHETNDHGLAGTIGLTGKMAAGGRTLPNMGSTVNRVRPASTPFGNYVTVGPHLFQGHRPIQGEGGGILGSSYDPFRVEVDELDGVQIHDLTPPDGVTRDRIDRRRAFQETVRKTHAGIFENSPAAPLKQVYDQAFGLMTDRAAKAVFDIDREKQALRDRYGRFRFGQSLLLARRLVEARVPFVQVNWSSHVESEEDWGDGGWDQHYRNFEILQDRIFWMFDQAFSAFLEDLKQRGLLETTLVIAMGEFGRTPRINEKAGRDHWNPCYTALLAGGGVKGGRVVGASDARGEYPVERPVKPADICLTALHTLGIERTDLLALEIAPEGSVVEELF